MLCLLLFPPSGIGAGLGIFGGASPFGVAPVFSFFVSIARPRLRCAFSWFAPIAGLGFPVLASGSNRSVKLTRLRRAAYFRSLACPQ
ncbi:DUF1010 domain-containing protein [Simplicispira psychrophila]|uniref:DUF1010 domain-containing protein n=1 Tax=Simplicispira psychrophila TaxID=80882 RepID=UPI0012EC8FBE|nr:DUF1010 domain-containing protein [Simplicispira psychrophila]